MTERILKRQVGIGCILLAVCVPIANDCAAQSVTKPDAGLVREASIAAYDAIDQIPATDVSGIKLQLIINLATAQLLAGDKAGARSTLGVAKAIIGPRESGAPDLLVLQMRSGDRRTALEALQRLPDASRFQALGRLAAAQIADGDFAGANATIDMVEELRASSSQTALYESALSSAVRAFAAQGDISRARTLADKVTNGIIRPSLLGEIAKAQHKAGDQRGADETLKQLRREVETADGADATRVAQAAAVASASAGHIEDALALVAAVPDKGRQGTLYLQLMNALTRTGNASAVRRVADSAGHPEYLMQVGEMEQRAGRCEEARATFSAGLKALGHSHLKAYARAREVQRVVIGLTACGFFAEAVAVSDGLDEIYRLAAVLMVVKEEARRGDKQALKAIVPVAIERARATRTLDLAALGDAVAILARAGLTDEAKTILGIIQDNVGGLVEWQLVDGLNAMRRAQMSLGDKDGIARTDAAIEEARNKFVADMAKAARVGPDAQLATAMELLLQAGAADEQEEVELVQRAMSALGSSGHAIIPLMGISARFSPRMQKAKAVDDAIAEGDLAGALAVADTMRGGEKDAALPKLVQAQLAAGLFKEAFEAAGAIRSPMKRAAAFTDIVRAAGPRTP